MRSRASRGPPLCWGLGEFSYVVLSSSLTDFQVPGEPVCGELLILGKSVIRHTQPAVFGFQPAGDAGTGAEAQPAHRDLRDFGEDRPGRRPVGRLAEPRSKQLHWAGIRRFTAGDRKVP